MEKDKEQVQQLARTLKPPQDSKDFGHNVSPGLTPIPAHGNVFRLPLVSS